jgi:hypothetical protein
MTEQELKKEVARLQKEVERLQRLVFEKLPTRHNALRLFRICNKTPEGFGGVSDYEAWLRTRDHRDLDSLVNMHTTAIDALRYRRKFIQHEVERRCLHSSYGEHPLEHLLTKDKT